MGHNMSMSAGTIEQTRHTVVEPATTSPSAPKLPTQLPAWADLTVPTPPADTHIKKPIPHHTPPIQEVVINLGEFRVNRMTASATPSARRGRKH